MCLGKCCEMCLEERAEPNVVLIVLQWQAIARWLFHSFNCSYHSILVRVEGGLEVDPIP